MEENERGVLIVSIDPKAEVLFGIKAVMPFIRNTLRLTILKSEILSKIGITIDSAEVLRTEIADTGEELLVVRRVTEK